MKFRCFSCRLNIIILAVSLATRHLLTTLQFHVMHFSFDISLYFVVVVFFCSYPGLAFFWFGFGFGFVVAGVASMTYSWNQVKQFSNWGAHGIFTTIHVAVVRQWCRHGLKVNFIQHATWQKDIVGFVHVEVFAWLLFIFYAPKNGII